MTNSQCSLLNLIDDDPATAKVIDTNAQKIKRAKVQKSINDLNVLRKVMNQ
jgi:hypothetical protein